ncbi:uncharacterized protein [Watersipora subatra]|uniref:uncharacterized protein n=1 Tax=Watersipora subatra TaxID=2589382 RepID=UPI00355BE57F
MTHKCFKCDEKFQTSGKMVQHMRKAHSSFVEDTQMKIDRSKESSYEAKRASNNYVPIAKCPFCSLDCGTSKKLVHHLTVEHQEEDEESAVEPELKVIRVENDSDRRLFGHLREEESRGSSSKANNSSIVNDLLNVLEKNSQKELSIPGSSETVKVSSASIKLTEKRYRCFWCDAFFRKRGKLMDHIDMFHKANKLQIAEEAELLVSAICQTPTATDNTPVKLTSPTPTKKTATSIPGYKAAQPKSTGRRRSSSKKSTKTHTAETDASDLPNNYICRFICCGSVTGVSRRKPVQRYTTSSEMYTNNCQFFRASDPNPLTTLEAMKNLNVSDEPSPVFLPEPSSLDTAYNSNEHLMNFHKSAYMSQPPAQPTAFSPPFLSPIQFYSQHMAPNPLANQSQHSQPQMGYQQRQHMNQSLFCYTVYHQDPNIPLDLTVTRY